MENKETYAFSFGITDINALVNMIDFGMLFCEKFGIEYSTIISVDLIGRLLKGRDDLILKHSTAIIETYCENDIAALRNIVDTGKE